jgi:hypothetical protein
MGCEMVINKYIMVQTPNGTFMKEDVYGIWLKVEDMKELLFTFQEKLDSLEKEYKNLLSMFRK